MLVKIEDGFYLNSSHIIAIHVSKSMINQNFLIEIEYTPNHQTATGSYQKSFMSKLDADAFLQKLHQQIL
ncbi:hypothetical protein ACFODO_19590 [Acinetobacter sichuanensis]|uniref:Uncharacterized protein n=1 Tax=Acinetobacter sichuanensis TaxID=2136183 RepID=A0A371YMP7_9GAMM|nr:MULTISPECIES: hypothetical protein [Acinetobacter]MDM1248508.1 hypothetical protein [Acinetobacter sp. R933-2]MDM1765700.1 hypothetical protein [Acinetobacter sp. 226-1]MDM1769413.1 hypothetical protein [Acinetobacter sp. 226-4]RFC82747.1 hypothetical protein C9E89_014790 [Acinetobacter sichuanensis]